MMGKNDSPSKAGSQSEGDDKAVMNPWTINSADYAKAVQKKKADT
jgi:hypothetical protein